MAFTCITCEFVYSTHVVILVFIERPRHCILLYCVCAFECNVCVGMFEEDGKFSNFWNMVCEDCFFCFRLYPVFGGLFVAFVLSNLL